MHPPRSPYLRGVKRGLWMFWAVALMGCDASQWDPGAPEVLEVSSYTLTTTPEQGTFYCRLRKKSVRTACWRAMPRRSRSVATRSASMANAVLMYARQVRI